MEQKNNSPAVVQIQGLYKKYSKKADYAIENVTFSCHEGEIVGLLGHNGAGKSTTLKCLEGMLPFEKGSISISGYDIKKEPVKAKMNMGFVTDNHAVFVKMTGIQYVSFMVDVYKVSTKLRKERLDALEQVFQLGDAINNLVSSYSHGMQPKDLQDGFAHSRAQTVDIGRTDDGTGSPHYARRAGFYARLRQGGQLHYLFFARAQHGRKTLRPRRADQKGQTNFRYQRKRNHRARSLF